MCFLLSSFSCKILKIINTLFCIWFIIPSETEWILVDSTETIIPGVVSGQLAKSGQMEGSYSGTIQNKELTPAPPSQRRITGRRGKFQWEYGGRHAAGVVVGNGPLPEDLLLSNNLNNAQQPLQLCRVSPTDSTPLTEYYSEKLHTPLQLSQGPQVIVIKGGRRGIFHSHFMEDSSKGPEGEELHSGDVIKTAFNKSH